MAEPTNEQILQETTAVSRQISALSKSVLTAGAFKDRMTKLDKAVADLKPKDESPKLDQILTDFAGVTGIVTSIKDLVKGLKSGSGWEKTVAIIAAGVAGIGLLGVKIFDHTKLIETAIAKVTTRPGTAPKGRKLGTGKFGLPTLEPIPDKEPLDELKELVREINPKIAQLTTKVEKIGPKVATVSRSVRLVVTKTGELKTEVSSLNSGISGLSGHMTTFNTRMGQMTSQIEHMNRALTGSAP